jgi:HD-GYP domain-containing protein (c-di-GMP phosphodiesterase class II)
MRSPFLGILRRIPRPRYSRTPRPRENLHVEAVAAGDISIDLLTTELVEHARTSAGRSLANRTLAYLLAGGFLAGAIALAALAPSVRTFSPVSAVVATLAFTAVSRVTFEVGNGWVYATQLVTVPMLFALPPRDVPLLVAAGYLLGEAPGFARGRVSLSQWPIFVFNASYSLAPALVLSLGGAREARWHDAPLYVGAFAAMWVADFVPNAIWSRHSWGISPMEQAKAMRTSLLVDGALAPIGLTVALASHGHLWGLFVVLPLVGLLQVFARERQTRLDHALELSHAYRGTALLLGEMIEADDEYTGSHSRDVVDLVLAVADRLELDPPARRQAELAALLHDVGKVKIPSEIINKPGPLDEDERALMNTHTILGEEMLGQVGGLLGNVGHVVRSSHERWDGAGYPDGLAGEDIPIAARIVSACDAWSAMTTDRAYRSRLTDEEATLELRVCSGTQFDPRVVDALLHLLT